MAILYIQDENHESETEELSNRGSAQLGNRGGKKGGRRRLRSELTPHCGLQAHPEV